MKMTRREFLKLSAATGVSAAPFLKNLLLTAQEKYGTINGKVFAVVNDFFHDIRVF